MTGRVVQRSTDPCYGDSCGLPNGWTDAGTIWRCGQCGRRYWVALPGYGSWGLLRPEQVKAWKRARRREAKRRAKRLRALRRGARG